MMKIKKIKYYELTLNETEAVWLKSLLQNPLNEENLEDEDEFDAKMREKIWNELDKAVEGDGLL